MGIECRFVDPSKPEEFENAIDDKLDVYAETLQIQSYKSFQLAK